MLLRAVQRKLCSYYGHIGTIYKYTDYQGVLTIQFSLHAKAPFVTITKYVHYASVLISSVLINKFHCISVKLNDHLNRDKVGLGFHDLNNCFEQLQLSTTK